VIPIHFTKTITLILEDQEQLADNPQQIPPNTTQTPSNITQKGILRTTPQEYNQEYNYANQKPTQPPPVQSQENKNKDTDTAGTTVNNEGYGEK
jgi:hypothetical protein